MKIVFICSALEPGRDGVGDYTRRLACELIRAGHTIIALSLNDKFTTEEINNTQQFDGINLPVLRMPESMLLQQRLNQAQKYINEFNPAWISLQFVIFGYHTKGLPLWLNKIATLTKGRHCHIMFHELWLGMETNASKKHLIWGGIQKLIIISLVKALKPVIIQTNTILYRQTLLDIGFKAEQLPLFGNIPVITHNKKSSNQMFDDAARIKLVLFGHIHPNAPVADFFKDLIIYADENNLKISLTFIGISGIHQKDWINECKILGINTIILGEQSVDCISKILSDSTLGISTTPSSLLEKSGSVAAMREHGLPIICVSNSWLPKKNENLRIPNGIAVYKQGDFRSLFSEKSSNLSDNNISLISTRFINSLS